MSKSKTVTDFLTTLWLKAVTLEAFPISHGRVSLARFAAPLVLVLPRRKNG